MSPTTLIKIDWMVLLINLALAIANARLIRINRRNLRDLQASSEIERRFQNWLANRQRETGEREPKIAVPM